MGSPADARTGAQTFFAWYNHEHRHSGIGYMTSAAVHYGLAARLFADRKQALLLAYQAHPERSIKGPPMPAALPIAVWINPPKQAAESAVVVAAVGSWTTPPRAAQKGVVLVGRNHSIRL